MSSKGIFLPLVLLSVAFFTCATSQKSVCYIFDKHVGKTGFEDFWDNLPADKCSRFIYVLESINPRYNKKYLHKLSSKTKGVPIELGVPVNNVNTWYVDQYAASWANTYFSKRMHLIWDDNLALETKNSSVRDILRKWSGMKISQAITCVPGVSRRVATDLLLTSDVIQLYVVQAKVHKSDVNKFVQKPGVCVEPLLSHGVPREKIVIGLARLIYMNIKYKDVCKDKKGSQFLLDAGRNLQCMAKQEQLHGVMFWALSSDDYNGDVCGKGSYPLLKHYNEAGSECTSSLMLEMAQMQSGVELMKPLIMLYTICFMAVNSFV